VVPVAAAVAGTLVWGYRCRNGVTWDWDCRRFLCGGSGNRSLDTSTSVIRVRL